MSRQRLALRLQSLSLLYLVRQIKAVEVLRFLLETFPGLLDSVGLLGQQPLDITDDLERLFLNDILVQRILVILVENLQATDFLVDLLPLLDRDGLQESS